MDGGARSRMTNRNHTRTNIFESKKSQEALFGMRKRMAAISFTLSENVICPFSMIRYLQVL